jgi:uncharacterized membrane-anchored protein
MSRNKIILLVFALVAMAQMAVPAMMIFEREGVLDEGAAHKFRTAPIDPYDPFRGKYITLRYNTNQIEVPTEEDWNRGETVYVQFTEDADGFTVIESVSKSAPENTSDYLETTVAYFETYYGDESGNSTLAVYYPFDRFYMEESKAYDAEMAYNDASNAEEWVNEEWNNQWTEEEWMNTKTQSQYLFGQLQDSSASILSYSYSLEEYGLLLEEISEQSEMDYNEWGLVYLVEIQNAINALQYGDLYEEEIVEEVLAEEEVEREVQQSVAYSLVYIKDGRAVLKDVFIDEVAIRDVVLSNREEDMAH